MTLRRFTIGAFDKRNPHETMTAIEAEDYVLAEGFVTFVRDDRKILSIPYSKVASIAELDEDNNTPLRPAQESDE